MFTALGIGGGSSLIGGVAVLLACIPFLFYKHGERIRIKSRFAPTGPKKQPDEADEAEKGAVREGQKEADTDEAVTPAEENKETRRGDRASMDSDDPNAGHSAERAPAEDGKAHQ